MINGGDTSQRGSNTTRPLLAAFHFSTFRLFSMKNTAKASLALGFISSDHCLVCSCGKDQAFCCFLGTELQSLLESHLPRKAFLSAEVLVAKSWPAAPCAQLGSTWIVTALLLGWAGIWWRALTIKMLLPACSQMSAGKKLLGQGMFFLGTGFVFPRPGTVAPELWQLLWLMPQHDEHIPVSECPVAPCWT